MNHPSTHRSIRSLRPVLARRPLFGVLATLIAASAALAQSTPPAADATTHVAPGESAAMAGAAAGAAPSAAPAKDKWRFSLTPYLWVPAMSGTVGVRGRTADVNVTQGDAFDALSDLDAAFSLHFEAAYGPMSLFLDGMYASFESDNSGPAGGSQRIELSQGIFEVGAAYRVLDLKPDESGSTRFFLEPLCGVRVLYLDTDLTFQNLGLEVSDDQTWINVFAGARGRVSFFNDSLGIFARGDYGYGTDSSDSWNVVTGMDLRLASWCSLVGGYRWLNLDFQNDDSTGQFTYDVLQEGPFMAVEFRF